MDRLVFSALRYEFLINIVNKTDNAEFIFINIHHLYFQETMCIPLALVGREIISYSILLYLYLRNLTWP